MYQEILQKTQVKEINEVGIYPGRLPGGGGMRFGPYMGHLGRMQFERKVSKTVS